MGDALRRLLQAVRFERDAFVWMDFNDRATGDALIFVVLTALGQLAAETGSLLRFGTSTSGINVLFEVIIRNLFFWLALAGVLLFVVRMLFQAPGKYALLLRVVGFAYPTLLVGIGVSRLGLPETPAVILGLIWFVAVIANGVRYESELPTPRAYGSVVLAVVLLAAAQAILYSIF